MLKSGQVQLHVHRADYLLEGYPPHAPHEAGAPKGPLVDGRRHGIEGRGLEFGDVGGDGYPPEVCLLDRLVRVFQEQGNPPPPAHRAAHWGGAHHGAQGRLVRLRQVSVPGYIDADVRLG